MRRAAGARAGPRRALAPAAAALCAAVLACWPPAGAEPAEPRTDWTEYWRERSARLAESQRLARGRLAEVREQLKRTETDIAAVVRHMRANRLRVDELRARLAALGERRSRLQSRLRAQRQAVAEQALRLWQVGSEGKLKLLLSQHSVGALSRLLVYYDYVSRARVALIERHRIALRELSDVVERIAETEERLRQEQQDLANSQAYLARYQRTRESQRRALRQTIDDREIDIQQARQALEALLADQRRAERFRVVAEAPFAERAGALPWPVRGPHTNHFDDETTFSGMTIRAREGTPILAVAPGAAALVRWMPHYGMLLILGHDDGYRSIYAHNQSVHLDEGDRVRAGQVVATVGKSGGIDEPSLYFEIRHEQRPLDVSNWLQRAAGR